MEKKGIRLTGMVNRPAILIGQFAVLLICVGVMFYLIFLNLFPDKSSSNRFHQTTALLLDKKMTQRKHFISGYRADFLITYNVDKIQYNRWVSANGLDKSFHLNKTRQENLLTKYSVGKTYPCFYDPKNPEIALLLFRYDWSPLLGVIFCLILGSIMFYYVLIHLRTKANPQ